jgi:hypothetical protein
VTASSLPSKSHFKVLRACSFAFLLLLVSAGVALAHEQRKVGKYTFVVGFASEPALVSMPNSIDLRVTNTDAKTPVEGLDKTLQAEVIFGGKKTPLKLRARFGQPGAYLGDFIPTRSGTYIFHLTGKVEDTTIDEQFESGPNTFSDVQDTAEMQFPEPVPAPADLARQVQAAQSAAAGAQTFGIAGVVAGILGLIAGGVALLRRR